MFGTGQNCANVKAIGIAFYGELKVRGRFRCFALFSEKGATGIGNNRRQKWFFSGLPWRFESPHFLHGGAGRPLHLRGKPGTDVPLLLADRANRCYQFLCGVGLDHITPSADTENLPNCLESVVLAQKEGFLRQQQTFLMRRAVSSPSIRGIVMSKTTTSG